LPGPAPIVTPQGAAAAQQALVSLAALESTAEPTLLSRSGLYSSFATKTVSPAVFEFEPTYPLWSDGSHKRRFLFLPPGTKIDTSDMDHWVFPAGTKVFKEFRFQDTTRILETRLIEIGPGGTPRYIGSFVWDLAQTDGTWTPAGATLTGKGPALGVNGPDPSFQIDWEWDVPSESMCNNCHQGEPGFILGFSAIQLSPATMQQLVSANVLTNPPPAGHDYSVPGNAKEQAALGYLHGNCGHCHNPGTGMMHNLAVDFRLDVADRSIGETPTYRTAVGVAPSEYLPPVAPAHVTKIVAPGDPADSEIIVRMSDRNYRNPSIHYDTPFVPNTQMPEIGTNVVDFAGVAMMTAWITTATIPPLTYTPPPHRAPARAPVCSLVINEVHMQSAQLRADEFVELFNPCPSRIVLDSAWRLLLHEDVAGNDVPLKALGGLSVEPGGYLLVAGDGFAGRVAQRFAPIAPRARTDHTRVGPSPLSVIAGSVALVNGATVVDSVSWSVATVRQRSRARGLPMPPPGLSLARSPNGTASGVNDADFIVEAPTPGAPNR
jgi:hypothetical protein